LSASGFLIGIGGRCSLFFWRFVDWDDFVGGFSLVVAAFIYIGSSNNQQKSFRGQKAKALSSEA
jgi:hypothetical protein